MDPRSIFRKCYVKAPTITARDVSISLTEPFIVWCNKYVESRLRDPLDAFHKLLFQRGMDHEKELTKDVLELEYKTEEEGFHLTLKELFKGTKSLHDAPLVYNILHGRPDLLEKDISHKSVFGNHHYIIKEIKLAKRIKPKHILQGAFYNHLIGKIQGFTPDVFYIINGDDEEIPYNYKDYEEILMNSIIEANRIVMGKKIRPLYNSDWPWNSYSCEQAIKEDDISLLFKVGHSIRVKLNSIWIFTIDDMVDATKNEITALSGISDNMYSQWMNQIISLKEKKPKIIRKPEIKKAKTEIYFDIEGDTELGIDYLYGLLIDGKFISFWADTPEDEGKMFKEFLEFIKEQEDFVLYHYAPYEKSSINRLASKYGIDEELYQKIMGCMVDLFSLLTKSVTLPIYSYSIKDVAKYFGFSWRAKDASGSNSMEWYFRYVEGEKELKQKILDYNEDDVRATQLVKEFLGKL